MEEGIFVLRINVSRGSAYNDVIYRISPDSKAFFYLSRSSKESGEILLFIVVEVVFSTLTTVDLTYAAGQRTKTAHYRPNGTNI